MARACLVIGAGVARYTYSAVARQNRGRFPILRNVQTGSVTKDLQISVHQALKRPGLESEHPSPFNTEGKMQGRNTSAAFVRRHGTHIGN